MQLTHVHQRYLGIKWRSWRRIGNRKYRQPFWPAGVCLPGLRRKPLICRGGHPDTGTSLKLIATADYTRKSGRHLPQFFVHGIPPHNCREMPPPWYLGTTSRTRMFSIIYTIPGRSALLGITWLYLELEVRVLLFAIGSHSHATITEYGSYVSRGADVDGRPQHSSMFNRHTCVYPTTAWECLPVRVLPSANNVIRSDPR